MTPRRPRRRRRTTRHLLVAAGAITLLGVALVLARQESAGERFRDTANSLCRASKHRIDVASTAQLSGAATPAAIATFLEDVLVPELRDRLAALGALEGGDGLDERLAPVLDDYEAVVDEIAADPAAAVGRDDPFAAVDARLDELDLADCGSAQAT